MPRGGYRPGSGGFKGNLNSLKHGRYSRQLRRALYSDNPRDWQHFLSRLPDDSFRARAGMTAVLLWLRAGSCRSNTESESSA